MVTTNSTKILPDNFERFIEEVAVGLQGLYGSSAAEEYRQKSSKVMAVNLVHPVARATIASVNGEVAGFCAGYISQEVGHFTFIHVLSEYADQGVEQALVVAQVAQYRSEKVNGIVCDTVPFSKVDLRAAFSPLGFEQIPRQLMTSDIGPTLIPPTDTILSAPVLEEEWAEVASCIVESYQGHPGLKIHQEVRDMVSAIDFVSRVSSGAYGPCPEEYIRAVWQETECVGVILGSRIAPEAGFVLQLAVRHEHRRKGMGTLLIGELARSFYASDFKRIVLGVTTDNPATQLYEKLGFTVLRPVDTFMWWNSVK